MPKAEGYRPSARPAARRARRARQAEPDARIRPYLEQALRDGGGCAAAVRYLRAGGIPSPRGRLQWSRTAVWRAAKRLGIRLAEPGSRLGALGHKVQLARRGKETAEGSHVMDQAKKPSVYRIPGLTAISETPDVQQYMRSGALQFWVAGLFMNQWVRQIDFEKLLKDVLSASVAGVFANGWLHNLDFSQLPKDLVAYYQRAGAAYRGLEGAEAIWETIPLSVRMSGPEALREFHASRDWSHIVPRSMGGGSGASEGIFEMAPLNRARGDATITPAELQLAREALGMEALRHAVEQAAQVAVTAALVAVVVEGVFAVMEEGLRYFDGEISKSVLYAKVLKRVSVSAVHAVVISGLIVGLVTLCPFLIPVLEVLALPLAVVSFTLLGVRFYGLGKAWWQRVRLEPALLEETEVALTQAWETTRDVSVRSWDIAKAVPELIETAGHGVWKGAKGAWEWVSDLDASGWACRWFSESIWNASALAVDKELVLASLRWAQPPRRPGREY